MSNPLKPLEKLNKELACVEKAIAGQERRLLELRSKRETFLVQYIKKQHLLEHVTWRFDVAHKTKLFAEDGMFPIHELCSGMMSITFSPGAELHLSVDQLCFNSLSDLVSFVEAWHITARGNLGDLENIKNECSARAKELNAMESLILKGQRYG